MANEEHAAKGAAIELVENECRALAIGHPKGYARALFDTTLRLFDQQVKNGTLTWTAVVRDWPTYRDRMRSKD